MLNYSKFLNKYKIFKLIKNISNKLNLKTYIVGGFIRNIIINKKSKDIDIVSLKDSTKLVDKIIEKINPLKKIFMFKKFGTIMINYKNYNIEFINARKESYKKESRNPDIKNSNLVADQFRRDFTVNIIYISINKNKWGATLDLFHGIQDLKKKIIKTPKNPNQTFLDDPLRIFRAARFATQLNFKLKSNILKSIKINKKRIKIISQQRIIKEINKIILSKKPSIGFCILSKGKILKFILPELEYLNIVHSFKKNYRNNFFYNLSVLNDISKIFKKLSLKWVSLLHDVINPIIKTTSIKFIFNKKIKIISKIFKKINLPLNFNIKFLKNLITLYHFNKNKNKKNNFLYKKKIKTIINVKKIIKLLNIKPSKIIGKIKKIIKKIILVDKIDNEYYNIYQYIVFFKKKTF